MASTENSTAPWRLDPCAGRPGYRGVMPLALTICGPLALTVFVSDRVGRA